ncbi:MAG: BlaI/MecI/CopY family transcriptional regulator [Phycisphaerae bacterium]
MDVEQQLTRRERQIMDILFSQGEASVNTIHDQLPNPPAHTAVRTMLKILGGKGLVKRRKQGLEYIYSPRPQRTRAGRSAMQRVVQTFFDGSLEQAVGAYLSDRKAKLSDEEIQRLHQMIDEARQSGQ